MLPRTKIPTHEHILADDQIPFARMRAAFAEAAAGGHVHRQYRVAGFSIDVRVVGEALAGQVIAAFAHLETVSGPRPALSIELWDEDAAGVAGPRDRGWPAAEALVLMRASANGRYVCEQRPQGLAILDRAAHRVVACTQSADRRYLDERARPFHRLLSTWLNDRGIQFVHAGLVSMQGSAILFGGHGGAGKSTSAIACLRAGYRYLGDDFIGLERRSDGSFRGYGLYASCLLDPGHMRRFPELVPHALAPCHDLEYKVVVYLDGLFPGALQHHAEIRAIALPRVVDREESWAEPASKAETLLALAPTSVMLLPAPTVEAFRALALLVDSVPGYRLNLGRDVARIPEVAERLITHPRT